ncbi:hypothetical protein BSKO_12807 [Bryopsis sp. KO-2023]|nr:hypothetical protein BSKO_12807 [Bryopsis sp. KO-2023]
MSATWSLGGQQARWRAKQEPRRPPRAVITRAGKEDRTEKLRELLAGPDILLGPCCHDALSAKLIERAGFPFTFMSGFTTSAAKLGLPDAGLITYSEMLDTGRSVHEATRGIPVIGDGDAGYGNAMNVKRTVKGYADAGFAGILIEDQIAPKSCGHVKGKAVVSRDEATARIRAAVDARTEGKDIAVLARTDARQAESLDEALWRVASFADQGADILFIDALTSVDEMRAFCKVAPDVPKLANMLEGGKTPILLPGDLQDLGFKLAAYPLSLLGVSIGAMESALTTLKTGRIPQVPSFSHIQDVVGFPSYFEEQEKYATPATSFPPTEEPDRVSMDGGSVAETVDTGENSKSTSKSNVGDSGSESEVVEADEVIERSDYAKPSAKERTDLIFDNTKVGGDGGSGEGKKKGPLPKQIRLCIKERGTGKVQLETTAPTGFLSGIASLFPDDDFDLEKLIKEGLGKEWDPKEPIVRVPSGDRVVEVFVE